MQQEEKVLRIGDPELTVEKTFKDPMEGYADVEINIFPDDTGEDVVERLKKAGFFEEDTEKTVAD